MAKQFLDYTGLEHYDGKIKAWANANFAKTGFNNVTFGTDTYAPSTLNDTIKFAGSAVSGLTKETGLVTINLTDEKASVSGHYDPATEGVTSIAVSATKLSGSIGAGSSIDAVVGVNKDSKGHILGLTTKTVNIPASISDSTVSDTDNEWVDITIVEKGGKLNSVTIDDTKIDTLPKVAFKTVKVGTTDIVADTATDILTLAAGSNITLTPDVTDDKVTITANMDFSSLDSGVSDSGTYVTVGVTQINGTLSSISVDDSKIDTALNALPKVAFKTITVGSTSIVADSASDTLTLVAGSNVTLTPDASADKLTIAANMDFSSLDATKGAKGTYVGVTVTETNGVITSVTIDDSAINTLAQSIQGGTHFRGLTTSSISDGSTATVIKIDNTDYTAKAGDIVILSGNKKEFIYTGSSWLELGDSSAEAAAITELQGNLTTLSGKVTGIDNTVKTLPTVAFKTIKVGSTSIVADTATDTLTIVGDTNITLTPDATNDKVTIKANYKDLNIVRGGNSTYVGVTVTQVDGLITTVTVSDTVGTAIQEAIDPLPKVAFKTVKVGSTNIEADLAADTLTLEAGSNITLTPDASADKLTIAANMNFSSLDATKGGNGTYVGVTVIETDGKITSVTVDDSGIDALLTEAIPNATIDNLF